MPGTDRKLRIPPLAKAAGFTAALCLLVAVGAAASAGAEGVVPVEGPWHATTSDRLPVSFEVEAGQVVDPRFRFNWGYCEIQSFPSGPPATIEPSGHWKSEEGGVYIEATFVAPDRAEGVVVAPSRMTPSCGKTTATFIAKPGASPFPKAESVVPVGVGGRSPWVHAPRKMSLRRDGSIRFYDLHWHRFGGSTTHATGRAYLRSGSVVRRPKVTVQLSYPLEEGKFDVYETLSYVIRGRVPAGFRRRGEHIYVI
jgi:hypothetical protein